MQQERKEIGDMIKYAEEDKVEKIAEVIHAEGSQHF